MSDIQRAGTTPRYSDFTVHQGVVYCVEVPPDETADIATQTAQMLASLEALLARAGSGKGRLLLATLYLVDMAEPAISKRVARTDGRERGIRVIVGSLRRNNPG